MKTAIAVSVILAIEIFWLNPVNIIVNYFLPAYYQVDKNGFVGGAFYNASGTCVQGCVTLDQQMQTVQTINFVLGTLVLGWPLIALGLMVFTRTCEYVYVKADFFKKDRKLIDGQWYVKAPFQPMPEDEKKDGEATI